MRRLVIGTDIDGVIVDYASAMLPLISAVCQRPISYQDLRCRDLGEALGIDQPMVDYIWEKTLGSDLLRDAPPIPGAITGLSLLSQHEIWLVTDRPAAMQNLTLSWLAENKVKYDRIVFESGKTTGTFLPEPDFDVFLEDQLEVAYLMAKVGVFSLLFDQPWNQSLILPDRCQRVPDWNTIVLVISNLELG